MLSQGLSTVGSACFVHLPAGMLGSVLRYGVGIPTSKGVLPFFFPFQGVSVVPYGSVRPGFLDRVLLIPGHLWEAEKPPGPWAGTASSSSCCVVQPCSRWSFDTFDCFKDWGIAFFFLYCVFFRM